MIWGTQRACYSQQLRKNIFLQKLEAEWTTWLYVKCTWDSMPSMVDSGVRMSTALHTGLGSMFSWTRVRTAKNLRISSRRRLPFQKSLNQGLSLLIAEMLMMDTMRHSARDILSHKTGRTTPKHKH